MQPVHCIAVVESDELVRQLIARWLGDEGHTVVLVGAAPTKTAPDTDLMIMSVSSRRNAAARIRSIQQANETPLLVISAAFGRHQDRAELARQLGVRGVLAKPFTREELLVAIQEALGRD